MECLYFWVQPCACATHALPGPDNSWKVESGPHFTHLSGNGQVINLCQGH
jgi:hypothetical protein